MCSLVWRSQWHKAFATDHSFLSVRYLNAGDAETLAILHHVKNGTKYDDSLTSNHFESLRLESEVRALFDQQSLKNLDRLVSEISYDIALDTPCPTAL